MKLKKMEKISDGKLNYALETASVRKKSLSRSFCYIK